MIDMKIQKLRCDIHNLFVNLNSLIDACHNHGIDTGDKAIFAKEIGALVGDLLHTQSPITDYNFEDHLIERCPDLSRAERTEARVLYSLVCQLMKAQSLLFQEDTLLLPLREQAASRLLLVDKWSRRTDLIHSSSPK